MTRELILRPEATSDPVQAAEWRQTQRPHLGEEFLDAFEKLPRRIFEQPFSFPLAARGVRRAVMQRFPYVVYFTGRDDRIVVIACLHGGRDPGVWRSRL